MPSVITIDAPEVVQLIEQAAKRFTAGNKTAVIKLAFQSLLDQHSRNASLFGAHPGSVTELAGVDLTAPALTDPPDAR